LTKKEKNGMWVGRLLTCSVQMGLALSIRADDFDIPWESLNKRKIFNKSRQTQQRKKKLKSKLDTNQSLELIKEF
jgi:hypothetical protein